MSILDRRCFHHDAREAVAQCPSCKLFFCRECVTEHAGRMICVTCVNALTRDAGKSARAARARWTVTALLGLLIAWLVFYYLGLTLARIPSKFHGVSEESALQWGRFPTCPLSEPRPQGVPIDGDKEIPAFGGASFSLQRRLQPASAAPIEPFFDGAIPA